MHCSACGNVNVSESVFCVHCGSNLKNDIRQVGVGHQQNRNNKSEDKSNIGFNILSFFFPIVGLVLFFVLKDATPKKAKGAGKSAIAGLIVGIIISILLSLLPVIFIKSTTGLSPSEMTAIYENVEKYAEDYKKYIGDESEQ